MASTAADVMVQTLREAFGHDPRCWSRWPPPGTGGRCRPGSPMARSTASAQSLRGEGDEDHPSRAVRKEAPCHEEEAAVMTSTLTRALHRLGQPPDVADIRPELTLRGTS
jgi:hypothetical protein